MFAISQYWVDWGFAALILFSIVLYLVYSEVQYKRGKMFCPECGRYVPPGHTCYCAMRRRK